MIWSLLGIETETALGGGGISKEVVVGGVELGEETMGRSDGFWDWEGGELSVSSGEGTAEAGEMLAVEGVGGGEMRGEDWSGGEMEADRGDVEIKGRRFWVRGGFEEGGYSGEETKA